MYRRIKYTSNDHHCSFWACCGSETSYMSTVLQREELQNLFSYKKPMPSCGVIKVVENENKCTVYPLTFVVYLIWLNLTDVQVIEDSTTSSDQSLSISSRSGDAPCAVLRDNFTAPDLPRNCTTRNCLLGYTTIQHFCSIHEFRFK